MGNIIKFRVCKRKGGEKNMPEIKKEKMLEIEEATKRLLNGIDFKKTPYVDIVSMVKRDNFEVEPKEMDIETTGCLFVNDSENERLIMVNTIFKNPDNEQDVVFKKSRFITAHEYGHFILHRENDKPFYAHRDTYHRTAPIELEADYFARSILMPLDQFRMYFELLNQMGNDDRKFTIEMLSKLFKVTRNKVSARVEDLLILSQ